VQGGGKAVLDACTVVQEGSKTVLDAITPVLDSDTPGRSAAPSSRMPRASRSALLPAEPALEGEREVRERIARRLGGRRLGEPCEGAGRAPGDEHAGAVRAAPHIGTAALVALVVERAAAAGALPAAGALGEAGATDAGSAAHHLHEVAVEPVDPDAATRGADVDDRVAHPGGLQGLAAAGAGEGRLAVAAGHGTSQTFLDAGGIGGPGV